jgi:hypothetical protein
MGQAIFKLDSAIWQESTSSNKEYLVNQKWLPEIIDVGDREIGSICRVVMNRHNLRLGCPTDGAGRITESDTILGASSLSVGDGVQHRLYPVIT